MSEQSNQPELGQDRPENMASVPPEEMPPMNYGEQPQGGGQDAATKASEYSEMAKEKAGEYGEMAREKAGAYGEKAREQAGVAKDQAASGMERVAGMVRERTAGGDGGVASQAGTKLAGGMEKTAEYLRGRDVNEIWNDVETYARQHPGQAVLGAVLTGFLIGRILR